jgi:hypothetical protein
MMVRPFRRRRPQDNTLIMNFTFPPEQNPDWGFARNLRTVLMTASAEWVQGAYSSSVNLDDQELVVPNRDYPYEGLLAYQGGENWKFIDCVGVGFATLGQGDKAPQQALDWSPGGSIDVAPWQVAYNYLYRTDSTEQAGLVSLSVHLQFAFHDRTGECHRLR